MPAITVEIDTTRFQAMLDRLADECAEGFPDAMKEIGEDLVYSTRQRFLDGTAPDGSRWAALSPVTLALRARRGRGGAKPLIDTGTLRQSVGYDPLPDGLVLFANRRFGKTASAAVHQFGTDSAGRGRKTAIPARPFLGLSDADIDAIGRTLADALERIKG
jgi:phage virion morphogenesis protein